MKLKDSVAVMVFEVDTHGLDCPMDFCRNPRSSMCSGMLAASDDLSIVHLGTGAMQVPVLRAQMVMSGDRCEINELVNTNDRLYVVFPELSPVLVPGCPTSIYRSLFSSCHSAVCREAKGEATAIEPFVAFPPAISRKPGPTTIFYTK